VAVLVWACSTLAAHRMIKTIRLGIRISFLATVISQPPSAVPLVS
jgi:hypothetical protein